MWRRLAPFSVGNVATKRYGWKHLVRGGGLTPRFARGALPVLLFCQSASYTGGLFGFRFKDSCRFPVGEGRFVLARALQWLGWFEFIGRTPGKAAQRCQRVLAGAIYQREPRNAYDQSARAPWPQGRGHEIQVACDGKLSAAPWCVHPRVHHHAQEAQLRSA